MAGVGVESIYALVSFLGLGLTWAT